MWCESALFFFSAKALSNDVHKNCDNPLIVFSYLTVMTGVHLDIKKNHDNKGKTRKKWEVSINLI